MSVKIPQLINCKMKISQLYILILFLLAGCSAYTVTYERKPGTDYSRYKTYAWLPADSTPGKNFNRKYLNDRIMYYCNQQLAAKGMQIDVNNPDVVFSFYTYTIDKVQYQYNPPPASMSFGFGGPGYYMGYSAPLAPATVTQINYKEGTLVIQMLETKTQQEVWKGVVSKTFDQGVDVDAELRSAIAKTMYTLPVRVQAAK